MTSYANSIVREQLEQFLVSPTAEVLALIGDWGSGKTFVWNEVLQKVRNGRTSSRSGYAYVSLFGISSLTQLNVAIFQHSESLKNEAKSALEANGFAKMARAVARFRSVPGLKDYAEAAELLMALEIRDRVICFDDIERMSSDLSVTDLMGLASFLKERRNCKIIFISHTDILKEKEDFEKLSEKVVDLTLRFLRLPSEASLIAIDDDTPEAKLTREKCNELGINNIRVIRQIWRLVIAIAPLLRKYEPQILEQAVSSITLFAWCRLQPIIAPDQQFVRERGSIQSITSRQSGELSPQQRIWDDLLQRYGFSHLDELDDALSHGVANGYFDHEKIREAAELKNALYVSEKAGNSVTEAWNSFHKSFDGTDESVATTIFQAVDVAPGI